MIIDIQPSYHFSRLNTLFFTLSSTPLPLPCPLSSFPPSLPPSLPQTYLRDSGLSYLFPRVEFYLQEPQQDLSKVASPIMEGTKHYLTSNVQVQL